MSLSPSVARPSVAPAFDMRDLPVSRSLVVFGLVGLHMAAGVLLDNFAGLGRLHAYGILMLGLLATLTARRAIYTVWIAGYIVGCEVLWRMSDVPIFWEYAKYAMSALLGLAFLRFFPRKNGVLAPITYLVVLLPSVLLSFEATAPGVTLREALSFNLSGPISLAIAVLFFRQIRASAQDLNNILWAVVIPVAGIAARALQAILTSADIQFSTQSNFAASAGFGPNQVSAILSLGALACLLLTMRERRPMLKMLSLGLFFWFTTHSFLTFSRGGIYNLVVAGALSTLVYLRGSGRRVGTASLVVAIVAVLGWLVLPRLETFTQDQLSLRFTDVSTSSRTSLVREELELWTENPLTGVGPGGVAANQDRAGGEEVTAHTEMSRLLAEHGIGGLFAMFLLGFMLYRGWQSVLPGPERAWFVALAAWAVVEMTHAAMRLSAIGFCVGIAMVGHMRHYRSARV